MPTSEGSGDAATWQRRRRTPDSSRINIYIPPELSQRLHDTRARGIDINVSKVCQEALKNLLDRIEGVA